MIRKDDEVEPNVRGRRIDATAAHPIEILVTCEHGGNDVPGEYRGVFAGAERALASHRGFDAGAADVADALARRLGVPARVARTTRLLVDLNRSPRHPRLFSEWSRALSADEKRRVLAEHYFPYRSAVEAAVADAVASGACVLHVSSHSFAPVLDGAERRADVGLLYDPRRPREASLAAAWRAALRAVAPAWAVRRNYPYRGVSDGLTAHLRKRFDDAAYAGLELEVNQRLVASSAWPEHAAAIAASLEAALERSATPSPGRSKRRAAPAGRKA